MARRYATTKRGRVKTPIGGPQDRLLHARRLPHSHVTVKGGGKKTITRYYAGKSSKR
jgi:hypothetical protein